MDTEDNEFFMEILDTLKNIKTVTAKDCTVRISEKLFAASWMRKKKKWNVTQITSLAILHFSLQLLRVYKRKMQVGH